MYTSTLLATAFAVLAVAAPSSLDRRGEQADQADQHNQPQGYQPQGYAQGGGQWRGQGYAQGGGQWSGQGYAQGGGQWSGQGGYQPQGYRPQGYQPQGYRPQGYQPQGYGGGGNWGVNRGQGGGNWGQGQGQNWGGRGSGNWNQGQGGGNWAQGQGQGQWNGQGGAGGNWNAGGSSGQSFNLNFQNNNDAYTHQVQLGQLTPYNTKATQITVNGDVEIENDIDIDTIQCQVYSDAGGRNAIGNRFNSQQPCDLGDQPQQIGSILCTVN